MYTCICSEITGRAIKMEIVSEMFLVRLKTHGLVYKKRSESLPTPKVQSSSTFRRSPLPQEGFDKHIHRMEM